MLPIGAMLRGTYRVDRYLASGGFGNTYAVTNVEFNEQYAMKEFFLKGVNEREDDQTTVSVSNAANRDQFDSQMEKFRKEARRLRQLHNAHIVGVHDLFSENGTYYYVMDFINGESLSARMKRTGQPLSEAEVRTLLPQMLDALDTVHSNGLWHLDLKPANIMIDNSGHAMLIDFGASKQMSAGGGATMSTAPCYTPGYAPSEQVEQNMEKFGPWTDFYALGATLFSLLTKQRPPQASDIDEDPDEAFSSLRGVSSEMRQLVQWMMQPNRKKRPQSVAEIRARLQPVEDEATEMVHPEPAPVPEPQPAPALQPEPTPVSQPIPHARPVPPMPPKNNNTTKYVVAGIAAVAVVLVVVAGAAWYLLSREKSLEETAKEYLAFRDLPTEEDTLAYAIGIANTIGLNDYLALSLNVDTTYKNEFVYGLLQGTSLCSAQPETMTGAPQNAYLAGLQIGGQMKNQIVPNFSSQLYGSDSTHTVSLQVLMAGFIHGTTGRLPLMTVEEAQEKVGRLFEQIKSRYAEREYANTKEAGERFLDNKAHEPDVIVDSISVDTPEGVKFVRLMHRVLKEGTGSYPSYDARVTVHYEGRLIDGTVFDSSYTRGEPSTFSLTGVVKGFQIALRRMRVGSKWEVYIPQELAYGDKETGNIPPFSTLIFTIELISVDNLNVHN